MASDKLKVLAKSLYERRREGVVAPFVERMMKDWVAQEGQCYRNVDEWVSKNPDVGAVRGWLVFDINETSQGLMPLTRFTPHALIEENDGSLLDLTPSRASRRYPFLRHDGAKEEFDSLVGALMIVHLDYFPVTDEVRISVASEK